MSSKPRRTNTYTSEPVSERYRECLFDWLAAHAPLWNQVTYRRRQQYFDSEGDVWDAEYEDLYDDYAPLLGKATCQQLVRKNSEAWRSFFEQLDIYHDDADPRVTEKPSPPSYWGTRDEGYELHGFVRNDLYRIEWNAEQSTLEFGVGDVLEDEYDFDYHERITLELKGNPQWDGDDSRLELIYDEAADVFRVHHPVRIQPDNLKKQRQDDFTHTLDTENTTHSAAIDLGANNTLSIVTSTGESIVYHARPEFERFHETSEQIATLQSELPDNTYTSTRIQRLYDIRSERRDHSRNACVKHATEWLLERNVDTVYVGDVTDVLDSHWSARVNEKNHAFWSHGELFERVSLTMGDVGIRVEQVPEQDTSSACSDCGSNNVTRNSDEFRCHECELEAHADIVGAWNILQSEEGSMARPAALHAERCRDASSQLQRGAYCEWNDHEWQPVVFGNRSGRSTKTGSANPQVSAE